ncbi:MAG: hypothetical protein HZB10_02430 [Candidatus Yonathbacteria bacterium]|nr:hypothetical protein [Candidatus Yonathbacteria bacterium]
MRFPRLRFGYFSQEIEIAFFPVNSPYVALVSIKYRRAITSATKLFRFSNDEKIEGNITCPADKAFKGLPKEVRNAISKAIESFRNDCMVT